MQTFTGVAERGEGRGRTLGFPTANIPLSEKDVSGIFAARVTVRGKEYFAAAYANQERKLLEAHLLDFWGELYGQQLTIVLEEKLREDAHFDDDDKLRAAILRDVHAVRKYYKV